MNERDKSWRKWLPWIITAVMGLWIISAARPEKPQSEFLVNEWAKLPVLLNGRIQPLDSVAHNSLLMLRGKSTVLLSEGPQEELGFFEKAKLRKMPAAEWMLEAMTRPEDADTRYIFRIDNQEVLGLLKLPLERKYFNFKELQEGYEEVAKQAARIDKEEIKPEVQTPFEKAVVKLHFGFNLYFRIKNSIRPESVPSFVEELAAYRGAIGAGVTAWRQRTSEESHSEEDLQQLATFLRRYEMLSKVSYPLIVPPANPDESRDNWVSIGASLLEFTRGEIHPAVLAYARMADAYGQKKAAEFNQALIEYKNWLAGKFTPELTKGKQEFFYNHYAPFIKSISVYLIAFLFGCAYWINWSGWTRRTAFWLALLALVVHTTGLIFRMYLERRPPVTNLYSSAIFVGWGAVILGIILERIWKDGIGVVTASAVGVTTLIIAHNLSLGGDTMEMLRAVLDTNFWLATHVVVITLGYSAMFVAGFLAVIYVLRGVLTKTLNAGTSRALYRMVYGVICFATLFSFVGTILGGIWADQSWGRFWGWDPKENGALLIVIWCATILHARWGGMIRERGLMACAIFGNIITAFSWFGVNMLGVGLHSYGFMDKAFAWLMGFNVSQLILMGMALLPLRYWRSFQAEETKPRPEPPGLESAKPAAA